MREKTTQKKKKAELIVKLSRGPEKSRVHIDLSNQGGGSKTATMAKETKGKRWNASKLRGRILTRERGSGEIDFHWKRGD